MKIHGVEIIGVDVDLKTRCAHYRGPDDIIAIKFKCCGDWFSCHQCHAVLAGHSAQVWPKEEFGELAVLCGNCGQQLTVHEYLHCESVCPQCGHQFNSRCAKHHHLYFEMPNRGLTFQRDFERRAGFCANRVHRRVGMNFG